MPPYCPSLNMVMAHRRGPGAPAASTLFPEPSSDRPGVALPLLIRSQNDAGVEHNGLYTAGPIHDDMLDLIERCLPNVRWLSIASPHPVVHAELQFRKLLPQQTYLHGLFQKLSIHPLQQTLALHRTGPADSLAGVSEPSCRSLS